MICKVNVIICKVNVKICKVNVMICKINVMICKVNVIICKVNVMISKERVNVIICKVNVMICKVLLFSFSPLNPLSYQFTRACVYWTKNNQKQTAIQRLLYEYFCLNRFWDCTIQKIFLYESILLLPRG